MRISPHAFATAALLSVTLLAVAAGTPHRLEAFDYVTNGGFEDGTDWWAAPQSTIFDAVGADIVAPPEGIRSGRVMIAPGASSFWIHQTSWAGSPAGIYDFSARVWTTSRSMEAYVQAAESNTQTTVRVTAEPTTDRWIEVRGTIQITGANNVAITIGGTGSGGDVIYVDDVHFEGADPATMTPTATSTPQPSKTPPPDVTFTRTPTGTRTASPTKTPTKTPAAAVVSGVLRNGGFEAANDDGAPADWQKYGGTLNVSDRARTGTRAASLQSDTDSTKWLYQTVLVDGSESYEFSAWLLHDDVSVSSTFLRVSWYASDDGSGTASGTADSTERLTSSLAEYRILTTGAITAPPDAGSARLRIMLAPISGATATIYADDAVFQPAVPPDAAVPIASGDLTPGATAANRVGEDGDAGAVANNSRARSLGGVTSSSVADAQHAVINEVLYDPDGEGADSEGEWVEIYNPTGVSISLDGWSLADAASSGDLPHITIGPRQFVVITALNSLSSASAPFISFGRRIGNGLGNGGDRLLLRDAAGELVDAISWGSDTTVLSPAIADVPEGHSIERRNAGQDTNAAADFSDNMHPSPGSALGATSAVASARTTVEEAPRTLASRERRFAWLPWALAASMSAALLAVMSWRTAPTLVQRLRQHS